MSGQDMKTQRGYTLNELLIVIFGFCFLGFIGFLIYSLIHFILKFW